MPALDAAVLQDACERDSLPWRVSVTAETGSTSDDLRAVALRGEPPGAVLFAESQTAGRGRRENRWITPPGRDLMLSLLLRPAAPPVLWPRVTTLAALAVCQAIERVLPLRPVIKWPNDIFLGRRKVSGLLAETLNGPEGLMLVLGIGLNVNTRVFPPGIASEATSLALELGDEVRMDLDRHELALALLSALHSHLGRLDSGFSVALREARSRSLLLGRQIRAWQHGREVVGRALDLDEEGRLKLELPDGSLSLLDSAENVRQVY
ncbi:MAG TPA: biotin--[acetyl-CoA-carboxylase] ligase [Verrucomicrobiales bacterium]|nr:biotin--[acetyl-CoA-carboxylase] ligase [Verrucomicrobiales bacterium]